MSIELDSFSRFTDTQPIIRSNKETFGLWSRPEELLPENLDDNEIITIAIDQRLAGRPDIIALEQYRSQYLEWIIIMFNRPLSILGWPRAGTTIQIPTERAVRRII